MIDSSAAAPLGPLADALTRLARGSPTDLAALLHDVETHALVEGTRVTAHCHCIKLDGNGRPRVEDLVKVVAENILDYAIPRREIRDAREEFDRTGSTQKFARLHNNARKLFTDLEQSGEGGELLLFALAEKLLKLPQILCKMSLKTNWRMHVHGADGLHAGADGATGKLILYWGESKIHGDVTGAVRDCLASVAPMLTSSNAGERDLHLLQRHIDLADAALEQALKKFLDPDSEEFNSLEFRGLCLVGFDCEAYPSNPSIPEMGKVAIAITAALPAWKGHLAKRVVEEKVEAFAMHFLFVPFPSADAFRQVLRQHLELPSKDSTTTAPQARREPESAGGAATPAPNSGGRTRRAAAAAATPPPARPKPKGGDHGAR